jgi:integrase
MSTFCVDISNRPFGTKPIAAIREQPVRRWRKHLLDDATGVVTVAKAYRLLRTILNTAHDDRLIRRNHARSRVRVRRTPPNVPCSRCLRSLPWPMRSTSAIAPSCTSPCSAASAGELAALRRCDLDLDKRTVRLVRQLTEISGHLSFGPPKTQPGERIVVLPDVIIPVLSWHRDNVTKPGDDALIFTSPTGKPLRHGLSAVAYGSRPPVSSVSPACIFTTCAIPATCLLRRPGPHCGS